MPKFRIIHDFEVIAKKLGKYCGVSRQLASRRLHIIKQKNGLGGADNVIFDHSGGVYNSVTGELYDYLTTGGGDKKE